MAEYVTVTVAKSYAVPPARVFDAWLDPAMIGRFMFGPHLRDEQVVHLQNDPRTGGRFSFLVTRQGQPVEHIGEYLEIDRPRRLVFTWAVAGSGGADAHSRVIIRVAPTQGGCDLTLTHELDPAWADYAERTKGGWTFMANALAKVLG